MKPTTFGPLGRRIALFGAAAIAALAPAVAGAETAPEFFKGKTITVNVGYGPGGGYDTTARIFARYFADHAPGGAKIVVSNMPGSGSLRLANWLFNAAPKDGTVLGVFSASIMMEKLFGNPAMKISPEEFEWIGSIHSDINSCGIWKGGGQGIASYDDLIKAKKVVVWGSTSPGSETTRYPQFVKTVTGANFKIVVGFRGTKPINLAMQKGEVHASCGMYESSVRGAYLDDLKSGDLKIMFQVGLDRKVPLFGNAKPIYELLTTPELKQIGEIIFRPSEITRPIAAPPGTPADRVKALREAFEKTMAGPGMKAEGKRLKFDFLPMKGERIKALMKGFYQTPPEIVKKALAMSSLPVK
ncbi:MAG: Bug family tripartite tricarboxylate transporter substrate binding protein [Beijerinckiaceae bacterium]